MPSSERKILVIKMNLLGDTIAFIPTIESIRAGFSDASISLLTTKIGEEILNGSNLVNEFIVCGLYEIRTVKGFIRTLWKLRKEKFDVAIASSDSSSYVLLLMFLAGIPRRFGFSNPKLSFLLTVRIPFENHKHHALLNLALAKALGIEPVNKRPMIEVFTGDRITVDRLLDSKGLKKTDRFIVLHPGSNRPSRRWPLERFAELIDLLSAEDPTVRIVCVGTAEEKPLVLSLIEQTRTGNLIDIIGETSVKQLAYLLSIAKLFIGHSTGPLHIAYAAGTPTVSLWGAASPVIWGPAWDREIHSVITADIDCLYCEAIECPKQSLECMLNITVKQVFGEASRCLNFSSR